MDNPTAGSPPPNPEKPADSSSEFVWSFRGYRLRASEFTTAMVHFFRAEVQRANVWRQRLDATTNWAVITTGAVLSFAFGQINSHHTVVLLNILLVTTFLLIEARRYRYYELWAYRVRLMETDFFAPMLVPPFHPSPDWAEALAENLLQPQFPISILEAIGRRLRRNYLWIYTVISVAWIARLWLVPQTAHTFGEFVSRAAVGSIPGGLVLGFAAAFMATLVAISILTIGMHESSGEVLPFFSFAPEVGRTNGKTAGRERAWFRHSKRRQQLLSLIITDKAEDVSQRVLTELRRGVTSLTGTGMYTGQEHSVLMCAMTVTEIPQLKSLVATIDSKAFVIVMPAQEVLGYGFIPLQDEE